MSMPRYQIIYPDCLFRGIINSKNVAPPDDKWAEGSMCRNDKGALFIINRKAGDGVYGFAEIYLDTLGLCSGFADGEHKDIFEGDIVKVSQFERTVPMPQEPADEEAGEELSDTSEGFTEIDFGSAEEEEEIPKREIFADVPIDADVKFSVEGVVYMSGGVFYIQFFDAQSGMLSAMPLAMFFGYDGLPAQNTAVRITGNMYDDEGLYSTVLNLSGCTKE